jgi:hypothetical protein
MLGEVRKQFCGASAMKGLEFFRQFPRHAHPRIGVILLQ